MAIAVIGGLIAATFLSLVFVPSFYIVMDDLAHLFRWLFGRFIGASDDKLEPSVEELALQQNKTELALEQLADKIEDVEERVTKALVRGSGKTGPLKAAE